MSNEPQFPEAAVEAALLAVIESSDYWRLSAKEKLRIGLTAALPHLHRDWLEGLIAKLDTEAKEAARGYDYYNSNRKLAAAETLRAELEELD